MRTTIEITTRFCRVGNIIINRSEIANADTSTGNIVMKNGTKYNVPAKVAKHIFNDIPCSEDNAMCMCLGIEDLAANALIRILSRGQAVSESQRFIRFSLLLDYGMAVVKKLTSKGKEATLIYDRESNSMLFRDYSDFFERMTDAEGYAGIHLKKGIQVDDIIKRFIGQIPSSVQLVLSDNAILNKFFVAASPGRDGTIEDIEAAKEGGAK